MKQGIVKLHRIVNIIYIPCWYGILTSFLCSSNLAQIPTDNMQKWTIRFLNNILFRERKCFVLKSRKEKPWIKYLSANRKFSFQVFPSESGLCLHWPVCLCLEIYISTHKLYLCSYVACSFFMPLFQRYIVKDLLPQMPVKFTTDYFWKQVLQCAMYFEKIASNPLLYILGL